jgi:ATP-binding cassette, subfamily B, bacterial
VSSRRGAIPGIAALLWRSCPPLAALVLALLLASAVLPAAVILQTGALVNAVQAATGAAGDTRVITALLLLAGLYAVQQALGPVSYAATRSLGSRSALLLRETVMDATLTPHGIAHLEDPRTAEMIAMATGTEGRAFAPAEMAGGLFALLSSRLRGLAAALLLLSFRPWAPFALLAAWSLIPLWIRRQTRTQMERTESVTPALREADYVKDLLTRSGPAKEIRIFGLAAWLRERYAQTRLQGLDEIWRARRSRRWTYIPYLLLPIVVSGLVLANLARAAGTGSLGLPQFAVYVLAVVGVKEWGRTMAWWMRSLFGSGSVAHALALRQHTRGPASLLAGSGGAAGMPRHAIVFEGVAFRYPGSGTPVFESLDLEIPAGRSLAIVGRNGAGKTTLAKLLARLYDPAGGRILVDGTDLRTIAPEAWRRRVAVIFQDFVRYELGARENVGFGCARLLDDDDALRSAAAKAGALDIVEDVGWDTTLSRSYAGGRELSGGQWQRVALARALAAVHGGASLLILDEPTANLDVRAEAALFDRFLELTHGLTTILVSHRMSSVRHADEICVVEGGRVIERGSHAALLASEGAYSAMFRLQAEHFEERPE